MPSKYRPRAAKIKYSTAEVKAAAEAIVPVARHVVQQLVDRCVAMARGEDRAPRRPRGRGAQLKPTEQLLVMFFAQTLSDRPREIAEALGMHPRTVARVLASKKYEKVDAIVAAGVIRSMGGARAYVRSIFRR
jgi:hypothetical protein